MNQWTFVLGRGEHGLSTWLDLNLNKLVWPNSFEFQKKKLNKSSRVISLFFVCKPEQWPPTYSSTYFIQYETVVNECYRVLFQFLACLTLEANLGVFFSDHNQLQTIDNDQTTLQFPKPLHIVPLTPQQIHYHHH